MSEFEVRILREGKLESMRLQADDAAEVRNRLRAQGMRILSIHPLRRVDLRLPSRKSGFELGLFIHELNVLLDAGLVLVEAVEALREKAPAGINRDVLAKLTSAMYQGQSFSKALDQQTEVFPSLLVATAASSEQSGQLGVALQRYRQYEAHIETIRKRVRSALMYPVIVMSIGTIILLFMMFFVVPRFASVFDSVGNLPASGRFMVWWGTQVGAHGLQIGIGLAALVIVTAFVICTKTFKAAATNLLWRIPQLREQRTLFVLTRFYRTLGMLMMGGMPVVPSIELAGGVLPSDYARRLSVAIGEIREGIATSTVFTQHALTTPVAERLLRVGEQSGELAAMCERIAQFHDDALERAIETFSKVFGPVLMLIVGGLIGIVVFLLYMPIFELAGSISG
ncbi:type II secretion system protein [Burkholderia ubonensis]|uniref:General secretion pathway protein F n=1 Tax=Burkholderia ubonensis TaxID=101571 RepID=A0AB73G0B3_9BURK|nr:type II secretion system F family protein [Burkholderia ubonensis]KVK78187.1 type II secretion system protein [Burkholderia ubonensis]KVL61875.1 type II secretion system protein [Burkholderia ubonensis]KVM28654.1 type II secretion system protein [Burkholderia ubonensis]KVM35164.1 type II secretion system protein [Burkholderia ubonensis]